MAGGFTPRQRPGSFNLDAILQKLTPPLQGAN
jgi:hypothetical protein